MDRLCLNVWLRREESEFSVYFPEVPWGCLGMLGQDTSLTSINAMLSGYMLLEIVHTE